MIGLNHGLKPLAWKATSPIFSLAAALLAWLAALQGKKFDNDGTRDGLFWPTVQQSVLLQLPLTQRVRLPAVRMSLGASVEELVSAAADCNRAAEGAICQAETFAIERREGGPRLVRSFFLDITEVSLAAYNRCVRSGRCPSPLLAPPGPANVDPLLLPVVGVTQRQASLFCAFQGGRLPTEDEFERAARGSQGRRYPWGKLYHAGRLNGGTWGLGLTARADGFEELAPVSAFADGQTPEGVRQLVGNAEEWTSSEPHAVDVASAGAMNSSVRVVRGGHFADPPWHLRATVRRFAEADEISSTRGFRCAKNDPRAAARRTP